MPQYQTKPKVINALQYVSKSNPQERFSHAVELEAFAGPYVDIFVSDEHMTVTAKTLNGDVKVNPTDWLILLEDEAYPCPDKVFQEKYEPVTP